MATMEPNLANTGRQTQQPVAVPEEYAAAIPPTTGAIMHSQYGAVMDDRDEYDDDAPFDPPLHDDKEVDHDLNGSTNHTENNPYGDVDEEWNGQHSQHGYHRLSQRNRTAVKGQSSSSSSSNDAYGHIKTTEAAMPMNKPRIISSAVDKDYMSFEIIEGNKKHSSVHSEKLKRCINDCGTTVILSGEASIESEAAPKPKLTKLSRIFMDTPSQED